MDKNDKNDDKRQTHEQVGYAQPPKDFRFKPGVSGNPAGRPRGSLNVATILLKALREKVVINEGGRRKTVSKLEAGIKQLVNTAVSGDLRALLQLLQLARDAEARQTLPGQQNKVLNELDREVIEGILERFPAPRNEDSDKGGK